jgi:sugar lactone lactonase YvrE
MADYGVVHPSGAKTPGGIPFAPRLFGSASTQMPHLTELQTDGTLKNGKVFFDMTSDPGEDLIDGIKVDQKGNLYISGPGGLWIISPEGKHIGTIITPKHVHNMAWGYEDGKTLYLCARQ